MQESTPVDLGRSLLAVTSYGLLGTRFDLAGDALMSSQGWHEMVGLFAKIVTCD